MSDFARKLAQTKEAIRSRQSATQRVRLFLEPSGHPDSQAFARECYAAAGEDQAIIVQFVKPTPRPAAQLPQEGPLQ